MNSCTTIVEGNYRYNSGHKIPFRLNAHHDLLSDIEANDHPGNLEMSYGQHVEFQSLLTFYTAIIEANQ